MNRGKFVSVYPEIDVGKIGYGLKKNDEKQDAHAILESCTKPFNRVIKNLIVLAKCKFPENIPNSRTAWDAIDRISRIIYELDQTIPHHMLARSYLHIFNAGKYIKQHNEDYFLKRDFSALIKNDDKKEMITSLWTLLVHGIRVLDKEHKEEMWKLIEILLVCSFWFNRLLEVYPDNYGQVTQQELNDRMRR